MNKARISSFGLRLAIAVLVIGALLSLPLKAHATDRKDLVVGLKTLPMLDNAPSGAVTMAIVYDPANPASKADADAIKSIIDSGVQTPEGITISGVLLPITEIARLSQAKLAFIAAGLEGRFDAIAKAAASASVLTMSTDLECVRANKCVLGIVSDPGVEIYYSRAASEAARIGFDPAFTMLVKKV